MIQRCLTLRQSIRRFSSYINERKGKIQTISGLIEPNELGITLMHEHLRVDYSPNFKFGDLPADPTMSIDEQEEMFYDPLSIENCGACRCYFSQSADNMKLTDIDDIIGDIQRFQKLNGSSIVECSIRGIKTENHLKHLMDIYEKTKLNIISGTGYYLSRTHPDNMDNKSIDDIYNELIYDINELKQYGIIGEIGCTTNIQQNEEKVLKAAAKTCIESGAAITIHPGYSKDSPMDIIKILLNYSNNLNPNRIIIGHIDRGLLSIDDMIELCDIGVILEFDQFGWGSSFQHAIHYDIDYPSDFVRVNMIKELFDKGYQKQIVCSHDIAFKTRLTKYGGHSYDYFVRYIVPYMKKKGFSQNDIDMILIHNPRNILTFQ